MRLCGCVGGVVELEVWDAGELFGVGLEFRAPYHVKSVTMATRIATVTMRFIRNS